MHVIFDSYDRNNLLIALVVPLLPLAMCVSGVTRWRSILRESGEPPKFSVVAFALGTAFLFVAYAWFFWWNSWRVEYDYAAGRTKVVQGQVADYQASPDGKDAAFVVDGVRFNVTCCDPRPIYRGTLREGMTPDLVYEGMYVRITYLSPEEIVRIEVRD